MGESKFKGKWIQPIASNLSEYYKQYLYVTRATYPRQEYILKDQTRKLYVVYTLYSS
jgi:hypothetical protein